MRLPGGRVLQRVADQVLDDLGDAHGVGFDPHGLERKLDAPGGQSARGDERFHAASHGAVELERLHVAGRSLFAVMRPMSSKSSMSRARCCD